MLTLGMALLAAAMACAAAAIVFIGFVRWRLRRSHPEMWRSIRQRNLRNGVSLLIFSKGDRSLGDPSLAKLCATARVLRLAFFALGGAWFLIAAVERPKLGIPVVLLSLAVAWLLHVLNRKRRGAA